MFNLNHFYYFYMVGETGSVTAAAKVLHISQPALSKQLKAFEHSLDTRLFEKRGRNLQLTTAGSSLFGQARGLFEKAEYLSREFSLVTNVDRERILVGFDSNIAQSFTDQFIQNFLCRFKNDEIRPFVSTAIVESEFLAKQLQEHVIDVCISGRRLPGPSLLPLDSIRSPICLAIPSSAASRIKQKSKGDLLNITDQLALPWILPSNKMRLRYEIERLAEQQHLNLSVLLETDSIVSIVNLISQGLGIGFVAKHFLVTAIKTKKIVALNVAGDDFVENLVLWIRRSEKDRPHYRHLTSAFRQSLKVGDKY